MISYLKGTILEKEIPNLIIDLNGIGYEVQMPLNNFYKLPQIGNEVTIYTHFIAREDGQFLYGFIDKEQRSLFRSLIKVNGVGPKMALTILSAMDPGIFVHHILNNDARALEHIPGVGSKTAKRLLIDMRDKVIELKNINITTNTDDNATVKDAISALIALGYKPQEARQAIINNENKGLPSEKLVRLALKKIK